MKVSEDVLQVLSEAKIHGALLTLPDQLDRPLYVKTNKVLEAAGGRWNRARKAHVFEVDPVDVIDSVILTGEILSARHDLQFFPTPPEVADIVIAHADLAKGMLVLEPSAGNGGLALPMMRLGCSVTCVELHATNARSLEADGLPVLQTDFLELKPQLLYERVVMNPPFAKRADVVHVTHALSFVGPGGLLVSIMSAGTRFRQDKLTKVFRELVAARGGTFTDLPENAFKASGTTVRTCLVVVPC